MAVRFRPSGPFASQGSLFLKHTHTHTHTRTWDMDRQARVLGAPDSRALTHSYNRQHAPAHSPHALTLHSRAHSHDPLTHCTIHTEREKHNQRRENTH